MSSLDSLLPHLYDGYTANWSDTRWMILRELAKGQNPGGQAEAAVTAALCATDGHIGHSLANIFLDISGQPTNPNAEMIEPKEYAVPTDGRSRSPDVAVCDPAKQLLLLAEGKRDAHINGHLGYCPLDPDGYSNQVICYLHGCWAPPDALDGTSFLWVHPYDTTPWSDGLNERQLDNPSWVEYVGGDAAILRRAIETQGTAINRWRTATWEDMAARIYDLREPAAEVIATIISTWLAR
jgi:hypothetical protein